MSAEKDKYGYEKLTEPPANMQPWRKRHLRFVEPKNVPPAGEYVLIDCRPALDDKEFQHQVLVLDEQGRPLPGIRIVVAYSDGEPISLPRHSDWEHGETDLRGKSYRTDGSGRASHPTGKTGGERIWVWDIDDDGDLKLASIKVQGCAVVNEDRYHNRGVHLTFQRRKAEHQPPPGPGKQPELVIKGPYWSAEVQLLSAPVPMAHAASSPLGRLLFVHRQPRALAGSTNVYLPGTLLVLCSVRSVAIAPAAGFTYRWQRAGDTLPDVKTAAALQAAIRTGSAALLVVRGDPDQVARGELVFECLNGEISLDSLQPQGNALENFYRAVGLQQAGAPVPDFAQRRAASVHASGVSLYARIQLPWEAQPLALPIQIARQFPTADRPDFRLSLETDRLTAGEEDQVARAWRRLSGYVNPKHPLNERPASPLAFTPIWLTLELTNPRSAPRFFGEIDTWKAEGAIADLQVETGEISLLISDQQPYDSANPAVSLARVQSNQTLIRKAGANLQITVQAKSDNPAGKGAIEYIWERESKREDLTLQGFEVGFDPVQTAGLLRQQQDRLAPEWLPDLDQPEPLAEPLLWGFLPLEDGWVELPFLNLTAQIMLDAEVGPQDAPETPAPFLLTGAASIGNDHEAVLAVHRDEQPWNITVTDGKELNATWLLKPVTGGGYELATVSATMTGPEVVLNGLLWIAAGRRTPEDALPDLADWVRGLQSLPVKTVDPAFDLFPPPVLLKLTDLVLRLADRGLAGRRPTAQLGNWSFHFQTNPLAFDPLIAKRVIPPTVFQEPAPGEPPPWPSPLLWRRHPSLPMIQALPLTQSKQPPTFPGASRQLVPFALGAQPSAWRFSVPAANAAQRWPQFDGSAPPAAEWVGSQGQRGDLPLVALSVPGLLLDPTLPAGTGVGSEAGLALPAQLRYDLPYLDQVMALAQAPKIARAPDEVSPLPDEAPPAPPPPLERSSYAEHWERLAQQAALAAADAVTVFVSPAPGQYAVENLVEPFLWPAAPAVDVATYPGELALTDPTTGAQIMLAAESALKGIGGHFTPAAGEIHLSANGAANGAGPDAFVVDAGSMAARPQSGGLRDQRGLLRQATVAAPGGLLLQTPVEHERTATVVDRYLLTSTLTPLDLQLAPGAASWRFWCRDLPVNAASAAFSRQEITSHEALSRDLDVNDPEALGRDYNYRQGYEWRLGSDDQAAAYLDLGGLRIYPLTLESVQLGSGQQIEQMTLVGRLQLPLAAPNELVELSNAVQLRFTRPAADAGLLLDAVALLVPTGEWPLALAAGAEVSGGPLLLWRSIELKQSEATPQAPARRYLAVDEVQLRFFLFDVEWVLPLAEPLKFYLDGEPQVAIARTYTFADAETEPIQPQKVDLALALAAPYAHTCDFFLRVRLAARAAEGLLAQYSFRPGADRARVYDVAGGAAPLHLKITQPDTVKWAETGLVIAQPQPATALVYDGPAEALVAALRAARESSLELWITAEAGVTAPIVTLYQHGQQRLSISQAGAEVRVKMEGDPPLAAALPLGEPVHIVYTSDEWGQAKLYINGAEAAAADTAAQYQTPDNTVQLVLANSLKGGSPWRGQFHQFGIAGRALQADEVKFHYARGPRGGSLRSSFQVASKFALLATGAAVPQDEIAAETLQIAVFDDMPVQVVEEAYLGGRSLQYQWESYTPSADGAALYLLPGMALKPEAGAPGYAVFTFAAQGSSGPAGVPALRLTAAFMEIMLTCTWGSSLQDPRPAAEPPTPFGSSAGDLLFNYTARFVPAAAASTAAGAPQWDETFLLNGMVEVTDLVSWPLAMSHADGSLQLPDLRVAPSLDHMRHTVRVLLNQHEIPPQALVVGEGPLLFALGGRQAWQFLAVVEHQLIDAYAQPSAPGDSRAAWEVTYRDDRRWTALQEVRWAGPRAFKAFLDQLGDGKLVNSDGTDASAAAYFDPRFRSLLADEGLQRLPHDVILVEASAPHWIKCAKTNRTSATALQYLPFGVQAAILSGPDEYTARGSDAGIGSPASEWLLLTMPFLGRIQPNVRDFAVPSDPSGDPQATPNPLERDPMLVLAAFAGGAGGTGAPPLALALANWADGAAATFALPDFDLHVGRYFPRLDPFSLEENWFRLQNPLLEGTPPGLRSVAAALPPTPGRLSRATALRRAVDSFRPAYPPAAIEEDALFPAGGYDTEPVAATLVWRQDSLLVFHAGIAPSPAGKPPYAWHYVGLQARQGLPAAAEEAAGQDRERDPRRLRRRYFPAATLIPTPPKLPRTGGVRENPTPLSFAVSPYLGLEMLYAAGSLEDDAASSEGRIKVGELLCIDRQELRPVGSYIWEFKRHRKGGDGNGGGSGEAVWPDMQWEDWAKETHKRLASESFVAVLRFREILRLAPAEGSPSEAPIVVRYGFQLVTTIQLVERLEQRTQRIRSTVGTLRHRQGQYGGYRLPAAQHAFELAPPQTTGLQPIHLTQSPLEAEPWPWGISGLRVSVQYTQGGQGVVGSPKPAGDVTLWWQAAALAVQFRSAERSQQGAANLPYRFRAPAIRSLLPVLPDPPLPEVGPADLDEAAGNSWQPVLPGRLRYLVTGSRPGVMFAVRNLLLRQSGLVQAGKTTWDTTTASSVPAQHRFPRPVPLPPNTLDNRDSALQTWGSYFAPAQNALVTNAPADEAFFAAFRPQPSSAVPAPTAVPARRLRLILRQPAYGALPANWNGVLSFDVVTDQAILRLADWTIKAALTDSSTRVELAAPELTALMPLEAADLDEGQAIPQAVRRRLEAEGMLAPGQPAFFYRDEQLATVPGSTVQQHWLIAAEAGGALVAFVRPQGDDYYIDLPRLHFLADSKTRSLLSGSGLALEVAVRHRETTPGFQLMLRFPLTPVDERRLPLPLEPYYVHFEDPEYNRLLASSTAHAAAIVKDRIRVEGKIQEVLHSVTLAADRREYNADSEIAVRFDWDDDRSEATGALKLSRLDADSGVLTSLLDSTLQAGTLVRYGLSALVQEYNEKHKTDGASKIALRPGDKLQILINVSGIVENPQPNEEIVRVPIALDLPIVEQPTQPSPQAGYALLRDQTLSQGDSATRWVECARFAWTPDATRVEMVCAEDLRFEIVRRRAVFQWHDSVRPNRSARHAVQKITLQGSTHFPWV